MAGAIATLQHASSRNDGDDCAHLTETAEYPSTRDEANGEAFPGMVAEALRKITGWWATIFDRLSYSIACGRDAPTMAPLRVSNKQL
jgi:hypothetical protein